jgi:hypothetical protein
MFGGVMGGPMGAAIGASLSSPAALKIAIQTGKIPAELAYNVLGGPVKLTDSAINQTFQLLTGPYGQEIINRTLQGDRLYHNQSQAEVKLVNPEDAAQYNNDIKNDKDMSVTEKAKYISNANKTGVGIFKYKGE